MKTADKLKGNLVKSHSFNLFLKVPIFFSILKKVGRELYIFGHIKALWALEWKLLYLGRESKEEKREEEEN